jgi:hypothetical protein
MTAYKALAELKESQICFMFSEKSHIYFINSHTFPSSDASLRGGGYRTLRQPCHGHMTKFIASAARHSWGFRPGNEYRAGWRSASTLSSQPINACCTDSISAHTAASKTYGWPSSCTIRQRSLTSRIYMLCTEPVLDRICSGGSLQEEQDR